MLGAQLAYAGAVVIISILFLVSQAAIYFFCKEKQRDEKQEEVSEEDWSLRFIQNRHGRNKQLLSHRHRHVPLLYRFRFTHRYRSKLLLFTLFVWCRRLYGDQDVSRLCIRYAFSTSLLPDVSQGIQRSKSSLFLLSSSLLLTSYSSS